MKTLIVSLAALNTVFGGLLVAQSFGANLPFMIGMPDRSGIFVGAYLIVFFGIRMFGYREKIARLLAEGDRALYLLALPTIAFVVGVLLETTGVPKGSLFAPYCVVLLLAYLPFVHEVFEKNACPRGTSDAGSERESRTVTETE